MPYPTDPDSLEGDDLDRWYRRSPQDIDLARQAAVDDRYQAFFGAGSSTSATDQPADRSSSSPSNSDPDVLWIADGSGGYRPVRPGVPDYETALAPDLARPDGLPGNSAAPEQASIVDVGNPHNPRLRREWEVENGRPWPKTADGQNYHVAHRRAIADGGTNTLDNIEPMHPADHLVQHINNGDLARWGRRPWIARAFGGVVEPPAPGLRVNGFATALQLLSMPFGIASGRIRIDTPTHALFDSLGYAAPDDVERMNQAVCRAMGDPKSGDDSCA